MIKSQQSRSLKHVLTVISSLPLLGFLLVVSPVAQGEVNSANANQSNSKNIHTINGTLDASSKKFNNNDSYYNVHKFEGEAGEQIVIELRSNDFDPYLILRDPENKKIADDDDNGEGNNARIVITLPSSGSYTIVANSYKGKESGKYQISRRPALPQDLELAKAGKLNQQVIQLEKEGKYAQAITLAERVLAIRKKALGNNHLDVATSLNSLAGLYTKQGKYSEAEPMYEQALSMRKRLLGEQHPDVAQSLNNLAGLYESQGRYSEAEPLYKQALSMNKRLLGEQHPDVATSLNDLALLYSSQGRYSEAEPFYQQALKIYKRQLGDDHPDVATSLNNLAVLYESQGRYSEAERLYKQALSMRKGLLGEQHPDVAVSLNNLALLYESQGRYSEAEPLYKQALEIDKRVLGEQHPDVAIDLNNLAFLYSRQGRYSEAEPLYKQALSMNKRLLGEQHPLVANSLNNLAVLYESQGKIAKALEFQQQGLKVEEQNLAINLSVGFERQKRNYITTIQGTTDRTISLHLNSALNNPQAANLALTTIFQRKGRILDVLTNNLQILRQRVNDKDSLKLIDQLSQSYTQLATLIYNPPKETSPDKSQQQNKKYQQQIADLEGETKRLEDLLSRRSAQFANLSQPVRLEAIQKLIPKDTALVEIFRYQPFNPKTSSFGKYRYAVYVLNSSGQPQAMDLGETADIEKTLQPFLNSLRDPQTPNHQLQQSARAVDKLVTLPIRKLVGNKRKILIAPDGALNLIPFEALIDQNNRYLIENYSFTYLTSGRDLLRLQNQSPSKQEPMIVADPYFNKQGQVVSLKADNTRSMDLSNINFPPLLGTREEAQSIGKMFEVKPFVGTYATEAVIKQLQSPKILHIATHGFFQALPQDPKYKNTYQDNPLLLSGLIFSGYESREGGDNEDGILTALEATGLNLNGTKLVVLSACDTSLGKDKTGEGLYNFRRALVVAGSESQVMSLWRVSDDATKDLMISYFQKILGKQGRSQALRQAQLQMLRGKKYNHPYYWAAFIASGNWKPIPD